MDHETQLPRSCDRCYLLKERCWRPPGTGQCSRCVRLHVSCQTRRPLKRAGRRPKTDSPEPRVRTRQGGQAEPDVAREQEMSVVSQRSIPASIETLSAEDLRMMAGLLANDKELESFILGPSFYNKHREGLISCFVHSRPIVSDAYMACTLVSDSHRALSQGGPQLNEFYQRASGAIATLNSLDAGGKQDILPCMALGTSIVTFTRKIGASHVLSVCSKTLSLLKPRYEANPAAWASCDFITGLIVTELAECLLLAAVPTLRVAVPSPEHTDPGHVDRFVGLSHSFLPLLYDLAEMSSTMRRGEVTDAAESLDRLEAAVRNWRPLVPPNVVESLTTSEVSLILCQAHVFPTGALLMLHRLRHPFGSEDATALALATSILTQLHLTRQVTGQRPTYVEIPLIAACMEVAGEMERRRHLEAISPLSAYSMCYQKRSEALFNSVWEARRQRADLYWYNLVDVLAPNGVSLSP